MFFIFFLINLMIVMTSGQDITSTSYTTTLRTITLGPSTTTVTVLSVNATPFTTVTPGLLVTDTTIAPLPTDLNTEICEGGDMFFILCGPTTSTTTRTVNETSMPNTDTSVFGPTPTPNNDISSVVSSSTSYLTTSTGDDSSMSNTPLSTSYYSTTTTTLPVHIIGGSSSVTSKTLEFAVPTNTASSDSPRSQSSHPPNHTIKAIAIVILCFVTYINIRHAMMCNNNNSTCINSSSTVLHSHDTSNVTSSTFITRNAATPVVNAADSDDNNSNSNSKYNHNSNNQNSISIVVALNFLAIAVLLAVSENPGLAAVGVAVAVTAGLGKW